MPSCIAFIPARCGSSRIPAKNIKMLAGKPLIAWSIEAALDSKTFSRVVLASDSEEYGRIGRYFGAEFYHREHSPNDESDIVWLTKALEEYHVCNAFAILRPTSPFRSAQTIANAWRYFLDNQPCDSLRAVEPARQHPGKMWVCRQNRLLPLLPWENAVSPWHSSATQTLPKVYMQTAALEIAWTSTVLRQHTIAGTNVLPFELPYPEGLDVNTPEDWERAERLIEKGALEPCLSAL